MTKLTVNIIFSFTFVVHKMEEEKHAAFQVVVVNECAQFANLNIQIVIIPYKDSEGISGKKFKKYLEMYLKCSKKCASHFLVKSCVGISKKDGRKLFQCSPSLYEFCDVDGNEVKGRDIKDFQICTLKDDTKIAIPKEPAIRFFSCVIETQKITD